LLLICVVACEILAKVLVVATRVADINQVLREQVVALRPKLGASRSLLYALRLEEKCVP